MIYHDLIVLGGGASGLIAAITAKDLGMDVAIVEGTDRIGKKLLTTGNGRCNISNSSIKPPFINFHSNNNNFFDFALNSMTVEDTKIFFLNLGLPLIELENKKIYPQSLQASSVIDIFRLALEDRNIPIYNNFKVNSIINKKNKFKLSTKNNEYDSISCGKLIISCGGKSAIKTGSDGSAYNIVKNLGHKIITPTPSIVQLKLQHKSLKALSGIKFNGYAEVISNEKSFRKEFGEILFTDYGISGPPILQISGTASRLLSKGKDVYITVDMMPEKSINDIENFLEGHFAVFSHRAVIDSLIGIINKKLIPIILKEAGITELHKPCSELTWQEKKKLFSLMKCWKFKFLETNGFSSAQVTAGGIDTKDINNTTLESNLVKNLYFCGEILDVDGDCGGFNLQWAWSSGFLAGKSASLN